MCVLSSPEVSILWASHQVHHSSEYYNLTTALRQSLTQQFTSWVKYASFSLSDVQHAFCYDTRAQWGFVNVLISPQIFYLPLALVAPPAVFAVHIQLNLLYQFWIHTEVNLSWFHIQSSGCLLFRTLRWRQRFVSAGCRNCLIASSSVTHQTLWVKQWLYLFLQCLYRTSSILVTCWWELDQKWTSNDFIFKQKIISLGLPSEQNCSISLHFKPFKGNMTKKKKAVKYISCVPVVICLLSPAFVDSVLQWNLCSIKNNEILWNIPNRSMTTLSAFKATGSITFTIPTIFRGNDWIWTAFHLLVHY